MFTVTSESEDESDRKETRADRLTSTYVPPRAQWAQAQPTGQHDSVSSEPLSLGLPSSNALPQPSAQASPTSPRGPGFSPQHRRGGSEAYYEDVDPRFAVDPASEVGTDHGGHLPTALTPGTGFVGAAYGRPQHQQRMPPQPQDPNLLQTPHPTYHSQQPQDRSNIPSFVSGSSGGGGSGGETDQAHSTPSLERPPSDQPDHSYENLPTGARSPGEGSEASEAFTSVSQRPVNPNWRPGPGSAYGGGGPPGSMMGGALPSSASAAQRRREDVILNANPDFSLPGMAPSGRGGRGRGRGGGGRMGMGSPLTNVNAGLTPMGRYPTDI